MNPTLQVSQITIRQDNHVWFFPTAPGQLAVVDPGESQPVLAFLGHQGWQLSHILLTHHHQDHQGGVVELLRHYPAKVVGAGADQHRLPPLHIPVQEGSLLTLGEVTVQVMETPGHTIGHVVYRVEDALFTGDTLFHAGCGRLFEGTAQQMWISLQKIASLSGTLRLFPGHEYSLVNLLAVQQLNWCTEEVARRIQEVGQLRSQDRISSPIMLDYERKINPFLNCHTPEVARLFHLAGQDGATVLAALRQWRNSC
ncbi:MAG: hydroxyacylglutathione hydrolase [Magnetococcales bacterium]|nr:hydroxyacylglutathione hydrolase [Magnetococcales bacterium]NGZ29289.1 hydroxyacylglutathione hydrolase [Magnetococcales bacterium]